MDADTEQNSRIRDLEKRVNQVENHLSAILAEMKTLSSVGKILLLATSAMVGIDVTSMMEV
tara:strand:+ start:3834 stop:4016 length:183 start_codon:yes stop_codon:yes gene_type:complete